MLHVALGIAGSNQYGASDIDGAPRALLRRLSYSHPLF